MEKWFRLFKEWQYYGEGKTGTGKEQGKQFTKIVNPKGKKGCDLDYSKISEKLRKTGTTPDGGRITCGGTFKLKDIDLNNPEDIKSCGGKVHGTI